MGITLLIKIGVILVFFFVLIFVILKDIFVAHRETIKSIEELKEKTSDLLKRKTELRGVTDKTQKNLDQINKNLEK